MAKINFELPSPIDSAKTFARIKTFLQGENSFKKFDPKVTCTFDEPAMKCSVKGSQYSASLQTLEKDSDSSLIAIEIEVSFALSLLKGTIQSELEKNLKRILS